MTIKYNYLFIYNPINQACGKHENISASNSCHDQWCHFTVLCYCHHLHHHNTQTCEQFCHNLYVASTYIFAKYSRSCKYFLVEKSDHRGRCSALALDCVHACAGWAWPSWGGAPAARKAECLSWASSVRWVQLCYHTSHQPGWLPSTPQMSSSPHQHETSPPSLGNNQGPPSSINIDENGDRHFKVLHTLNFLCKNVVLFHVR